MKNKRLAALIPGAALLAVFILMSVCPGIFTPFGQKDMFLPWAKPDSVHLLGTNSMGYDVFTELVYGARQTLFTGVASSIITMILGTVIGTLAAGKGIAAHFFSGLINIFVLLPRLITLIVLASFLGSSQLNLILLISAFSWVGTARSVRAKVISINEQTFIENCVIQGYSRFHIVLHHIIPNLYDVLISRFLLGVNSCIMMESTLSFLGFGDLYYPTWGTMVNFAYQRGAFIRQAYSYLVTPGVCIMLLSLSFFFISLWFESRADTISER